ncbi:MAG: FGGY family carbohydrate kinase [Bacteroidia bacterium]
MYLIGYDIGSSSIKAALVDSSTGTTVATVKSPEKEMDILAPQPGWAEQHPETWWEHVCLATGMLLEKSGIAAADIKAIGIAYQMHGLVLVDENREVLRPSIIWCDSRAIALGDEAARGLGSRPASAIASTCPVILPLPN